MPKRRVDPEHYTPIQGATQPERIQAALDKAGLTITDLANACGVRWQTAQSWVTKEVNIQAVNIRRIGEVTGVNVDELLGVHEGQEPPFKAWKQLQEYLEREGDELTAEEARSLKSQWWPAEPTLASYLGLLQTIRALR